MGGDLLAAVKEGVVGCLEVGGVKWQLGLRLEDGGRGGNVLGMHEGKGWCVCSVMGCGFRGWWGGIWRAADATHPSTPNNNFRGCHTTDTVRRREQTTK